jgi:tRNA threonylcarbamoyl adenosine modification protein YeaZ
MAGPVLVLDSGSPRISVAVGRDGEILAARDAESARSGSLLLALVAETLGAAGLAARDLGGIAALAGPGSFTGLRIGLATALGFHQALGVPATALPTLAVLAALAPAELPDALGAVDSLRGEWAVGRALGRTGPPELLSGLALAERAPEALVGFGVSRLAALPGWSRAIRLIEPGPLAPVAYALLADLPEDAWDPALLTAPLYARPPAVSPPKEREVRRTAG